MALGAESATAADLGPASSNGEECYLYGIVPAGAPASVVTGHDDEPVRRLEHGEVAAVVGSLPRRGDVGRRADLMTHSRVVDALAADGPVLPARFGTVLPSAADIVESLLAPHEDYYSDMLSQLSGKAQFNLRARYDEQAVLSEVVAEDSRIADLRERTRNAAEDDLYGERVLLGELVSTALAKKREFDGETILDLLAPHAVELTTHEGGGLDHLLDAVFLVDDHRRREFESAAEDAASLMAGRARLRLMGPLAPYEFVSGV